MKPYIMLDNPWELAHFPQKGREINQTRDMELNYSAYLINTETLKITVLM